MNQVCRQIGFHNLMKREVICLKTGAKIGFVDDLIIDTETAQVVKLVIFGRRSFFPLTGKSMDLIVPWESVEMIGEDALLVRSVTEAFSAETNDKQEKKSGLFRRLFSVLFS